MRRLQRTGKMTAVFAVAAMAMAVTACASTGGNDAGTAQTEVSTEAITESAAAQTAGDAQNADTESTEAETADTGESSTEASTIGDTDEETEISVQDAWSQISRINENTKLKLSLPDQELQEAKDNADDLPFTTKIQYIKIEDSGYDALQKSLDKDNEESMELAREAYEDNADYLKEATQSGENVTPYEMDSAVLVKRADERVVSYVREDFSQLGGAHPSTYFTGKNYDAKTGEELSLKDVVSNYDGVYQYVLDELAQREKEDGNENCYFDGYEDTVKEMFYGASDTGSTDTAEGSEESGLYPDMQAEVQWYLEDDGLTVIFNDYDIAPYAYGPSVVKIPFDSGLLNSDYAG